MSEFTVIDPSQAAQAVDALMGGTLGITIDPASLQLVEGPSSLMFYDGSLGPLGIGPGLLLTSGTMPATTNTDTGFGFDNGMPGDPALDAVVNAVFSTNSYDATTLSFAFDVTDPAITNISFNVVFGSDEYPEWVDQFVDIGAVIVDGVNVAYFGNDPSAPLSVLSQNLAAGYFNDNTDGHLPIEYDGVSNLLTISAPVHLGHNTIEIGVADCGDHILDSGMFISHLVGTSGGGTGVTLSVPGTSGDDALDGSNAAETFNAGTGDDLVNAGGGNDSLYGEGGNDTLNGDDGNDYLDGSAGSDTVNGGAGDDTIKDSGNDVVDGGAGTDTLLVDHSGAAAQSFDFSELADGSVLADGTQVFGIEQVNYIGSAFGDHIVGGDGNDAFTGGAGNDTVEGGAGLDTAHFSGMSLDYQITVDSKGHYLVKDLREIAADGTDRLGGVEKLAFTDGTFDIATTSGVVVMGTKSADIISPTSAPAGQPLPGATDDTIYAGKGNDSIDGGAGRDTMYGNVGNDTYYVDNAGDRVVENANGGRDLVYASVSHVLEANVENLTLTGGDGSNAAGNAGDNTIVGNIADNLLAGFGGNDTLLGGDGNDTLLGGDGNDVLNGGAGIDTASYYGASTGVTVNLGVTALQDTTGAGLDQIKQVENLTGSGYGDTLTGNSSVNTIDGAAGNDTLAGGAGADQLAGGAGADTFVYYALSDTKTGIGKGDHILDFNAAQGDHIDLSYLDAITGGTDDGFTFTDHFSHSSGELIVTVTADGSVVAGDVNGDGHADFAILVTSAAPLTAADFIL
jgi:Ca2+-binding RTX toxin-like protein